MIEWEKSSAVNLKLLIILKTVDNCSWKIWEKSFRTDGEH